jgi:MFS family permease
MLVAGMAFNGIGVMIDKKIGTRPTIAIGLGLIAIGFGLLASTGPTDGYLKLCVTLVVIGAGSGTAGPAAYGTLLAALPKERAGVGSAVNDTVQQVGQALSIAVLGSILTAAYRSSMPVDAGQAARRSIGDALRIAVATKDAGLARLAKDAFVEGMATTAIVGVVGAVAAAILAVAVLRPKPHTPVTPNLTPVDATTSAK